MSLKNMSGTKIRIHEQLQDTSHLLIRALEAVHGAEVSLTLDQAEHTGSPRETERVRHAFIGIFIRAARVAVRETSAK